MEQNTVKKEKNYTVRQSVIDTLKAIPKNTDFKGYDFLNTCRFYLIVNGSQAKPYDSTLFRELRRYRSTFAITVTNPNKSIYHKGESEFDFH